MSRDVKSDLTKGRGPSRQPSEIDAPPEDDPRSSTDGGTPSGRGTPIARRFRRGRLSTDRWTVLRAVAAVVVAGVTTVIAWRSYQEPLQPSEEAALMAVPGNVREDLVEGAAGGGFVCHGFTVDAGGPGTKDEWGNRIGNCPPHHAFFSNQDPAGARPPGGSYVPVMGTCCRLPYDDILTDRHIYDVRERCPDDAVITGTSVDKYGQCSEHCVVRCTYINTELYRLAPERHAAYWATPRSATTSGGGAGSSLLLTEIPPALRAGAARENQFRFDNDGCIGVPFGSLLVRKESKKCAGFYYRQLRHADGRPVKMYPECDRIDGLYDPNPRCITNAEESVAQGASAARSSAEADSGR